MIPDVSPEPPAPNVASEGCHEVLNTRNLAAFERDILKTLYLWGFSGRLPTRFAVVDGSLRGTSQRRLPNARRLPGFLYRGRVAAFLVETWEERAR